MLQMAMVYEGSSNLYQQVLEVSNFVFTGIFISEAVIKIIAMRFRPYMKDNWNKFDFFVVCTSILDLILLVSQSSAQQGGSLLRVGPQLARTIRVLRVSR